MRVTALASPASVPALAAVVPRRGTVALPGLLALDRVLARRMSELPHPVPVDHVLRGVSRAADHAVVWIVLGLAGGVVDAPRRRAWLRAAVTVAATEQAGRAVKRAVRRPRPALPARAGVTSRWSFPSSHTATAIAACWAFRGLLPRSGLRAWACVTALSRPYLAVHYPSDVLGGLAVGAAVGRALSSAGRGASRGDAPAWRWRSAT